MSNTITICTGIGLDQFTPEYVTIEIPNPIEGETFDTSIKIWGEKTLPLDNENIPEESEKMKELLIDALNQFKDKEVREVVGQICSELNRVLNEYLSENKVYANDFPIEFENEMGKWQVQDDGTTSVQLKPSAQKIIVEMEIKPTTNE